MRRGNHGRESAMVAGQLVSRGQPLSPRERDVLTHMCAGYKTKHIAHSMHVSHRTVETHRQRILYKTGSDTLVQLGVWAIRSGHWPYVPTSRPSLPESPFEYKPCSPVAKAQGSGQ